jgi:cation diffusion facilitator CzcD-associated flavoprotein CzcO
MKILKEAAIVGAGPYGLSLAAKLNGDGRDFVIIGHPMEAWSNHMPEGMLLKSDGFASNLYDPDGDLTLEKFCRRQGVEYHDTQVPVELDTFVNYGLDFAARYAGSLKRALVVSLKRQQNGFALATDDGDLVIAKRVIVASGIGLFRCVPESLAGLDEALVSHSYDHHRLSQFRGQRVAVVGAGASAIDLAGLLADHGCESHLICRANQLKFGRHGAGPRTMWQRLRHPDSGLGPGWRSRLSTDAPLLFRALPAPARLEIVRRHLGPAASWRMKEKIDGRVAVLSGYAPVAAAEEGSRVRLTLRSPDGAFVSSSFDHVVAATGYRVDVERLAYIDPAIRSQIACAGGSPVLSARFESSVPGLHFTGVAAAASFGPLLRFAFGAGFAARRAARAFSKGAATLPEAQEAGARVA